MRARISASSNSRLQRIAAVEDGDFVPGDAFGLASHDLVDDLRALPARRWGN